MNRLDRLRVLRLVQKIQSRANNLLVPIIFFRLERLSMVIICSRVAITCYILLPVAGELSDFFH